MSAEPKPSWPRCSICRITARPGAKCGLAPYSNRRCPFVLNRDQTIKAPEKK